MAAETGLGACADTESTVDFMMRKSAYFSQFMKENPEVSVMQTLLGRYLLVQVPASRFDTMIEKLGSSLIGSASTVLGLLGCQELEAAGIAQIQQSHLDLTGRGVLIGIIDTGIDYTQEIFMRKDGTTKIHAIYDQTAAGTPPEGCFFGAEYPQEQINQALQSDSPYAVVPQRDTDGHGTFLASLISGERNENFVGAAPDSELVVVKLRKARPYYLDLLGVDPSQQNAFEASDVMVGVEFILEQARKAGRPVAICLGLGTNFGSHDGFSVFEEYLSDVSKLPGVCLCVAAGNECQQRHQTQGKLEKSGDLQPMDLKVPDQAGTVTISLWSAASDVLSVSVRSPAGELIQRTQPYSGLRQVNQLHRERSSVAVDYFFPVDGNSGQLTLVRLIDAVPGIWTITVYGDAVQDGRYHAWLPITGFVAPGVEFLSADPFCTVTIPGTMVGGIICGAYNSTKNCLCGNTSWGPTRLPLMTPDLVAPGSNVGGYFPDGYGSMSGTSAAAAITTGACALFLQWGIVQKHDQSLSTYQIRAYLINSCDRKENIAYPNTQWGFGELNLTQAFKRLREL